MTSRKRVWRWERDRPAAQHTDDLVLEEPLELRIESRPVSVTMRTPGHDLELAAGLLLSEGLIRQPADLLRLAHSGRNADGNVLDVFLAPGVTADFARLARHGFVSSSCGLCGKTAIRAVHGRFPPLGRGPSVPATLLASLPERLRAAQEVFARTGGLHAAAVFDASGGLIVAREDVGRHNAVDKVLGHGLLEGLLPFDRHILVVSGRASFEIVLKALAARVPIVCAVSAPSSLAVEFARRSRQTLVGFLRDGRMNIYSMVQRIRLRSRPGPRRRLRVGDPRSEARLARPLAASGLHAVDLSFAAFGSPPAPSIVPLRPCSRP